MCVCVCVCVRAHTMHVRACVLDREGSKVFASTALVVLVVRTAMYLTIYNDYLTSLCEPLSSPYISVTPVSKMFWGEHSDSHQCHL